MSELTTEAADPKWQAACPCGLGPTAAECCGRYIRGQEAAPTAEALMRSRYSAYVLGEIDWILATHDPSSTEEVDIQSTEKWSRDASWQGLEVRATDKGRAGDETGTVEFVARYEIQGHGLSHHEVARFRKVDGKWVYADGQMVKPRPVVRAEPKVGRNDPCPCGSGAKFKKCHGAGAGAG